MKTGYPQAIPWREFDQAVALPAAPNRDRQASGQGDGQLGEMKTREPDCNPSRGLDALIFW